jgi:hypothetical protein
VIVAFILNLVFNHWVRGGGESAVQAAVSEGAVAVDVPDEYPAVTSRAAGPADGRSAELVGDGPAEDTGGRLTE